MISFEEHSKNVDHFFSIASKIVKRFDQEGLFETAYGTGWAQPNQQYTLDEINANSDGTVTLEASYFACGGSEESSITIPASMMDMPRGVWNEQEVWDAALNELIVQRLEEKEENLRAKAAKAKADQLKKDQAELARLQAKLANG